jgi:hypothetical protein
VKQSRGDRGTAVDFWIASSRFALLAMTLLIKTSCPARGRA